METDVVAAVTEKVDVAAVTSLATVAMEKAVSFSIQLVLAIALLVGGLFIARIATNAVRNRLAKIKGFDPTLIPILAQFVRYGILVLTFIMVLSNFGIQTTSIIAVLGAAGLAIGLALQGTLQNVAAGIMLLIIRPFRKGDVIEAGSTIGTVEEIGLFITTMTTAQGVYVAMPNSQLWSNKIVNFSANDRRRADMPIGISYDDDIDEAIAVVKGLIAKDERALEMPEPLVVVRALGDSSVDLEARVWVERQNFWPFQFDMTRAIKLGLDEAGISIPYPHNQIVLPDEFVKGMNGSGGSAAGGRGDGAKNEPGGGSSGDMAAEGQDFEAEQGKAKAGGSKRRGGGRKKSGSTAV